MKVEIAAEAALFPEKEYIFGIAVAVRGGVPDEIRTLNCLTACRRANHSDMPHPTYLITLQPTELRRTLLSYVAPY
jgi:hypothetical protein